MVKNTIGGSRHKGQARKFVNPTNKASTRLRMAEDEAEVYAQVVKPLGNGMCHVATLQGLKLLCIIRGKFRGRGKRDNTIKTGSWILVGMREWEAKKTGTDLNTCDLLEVYSDMDKDKLKNTVPLNWKPFIDNDSTYTSGDQNDQDELVNFSNEDQEEYKKLIEEQLDKTSTKTNMIQFTPAASIGEEEEINIDDI